MQMTMGTDALGIGLDGQFFFFSCILVLYSLWAVNNADTQFSIPQNARLMEIIITPKVTKVNIRDHTGKGIDKYTQESCLAKQ